MGRPASSIPYDIRMRAYRKAYELRNPEKVEAMRKRYREANRAKKASYYRKWREDNKEKVKESLAKYAKNNPEKVAAKRRKRRAILKNVLTESYTVQEIYYRDKGLCYICEELINTDYPPRHRMSITIHHVLPLTKGGNDLKDNVVIAHYSCNSRLGNRV